MSSSKQRWRLPCARTSGQTGDGSSKGTTTIVRSLFAALAVLVLAGLFAGPASAFPTYNYASSFGPYGSGAGRMKEPPSLATDASGKIYVADQWNSRIEVFDASGAYLSQFGAPYLYQPNDIAIDAAGNRWIVESTPTRSSSSTPKTNMSPRSENSELATGSSIARSPLMSIPKATSGSSMQTTGDSKSSALPAHTSGKSKAELTEVMNSNLSQDLPLTPKIISGQSMPGPSGGAFEFSSEGSFVRQIAAGKFLEGTLEIDAANQVWAPYLVVLGGFSWSHIGVFSSTGELLGEFGSGPQNEEPGGVPFFPRDIAFDSVGNPWILCLSKGNSVEHWLALPTATTLAATNIKETEATLNATVNPQKAETTYQFEYGTTLAYGSKVPVTAKSAGSGGTDVAVSEAVAGLSPGTTYHYRVVATNAAGATPGKDVAFTAALAPQNKFPPEASSAKPAEAIPETASNGKWSASPAPSFTYQWQRCSAAGTECVNIVGATANTYTPIEADVAHTLVIAVKATNSAGSSTAYSKPTEAVRKLGQITEYTLPGGSSPKRITREFEGNYWYTGASEEKIGKITPAGTVTEYSTEGISPVGIASGAGKIWFAGTYEVAASMTTAGVVTKYTTAAGNVVDVAWGPDSRAWFTATGGKLIAINKSGVMTEYALPAGTSPNHITLGPDGNLWFIDTQCGSKTSCNVVKSTTSGVITKYPVPVGEIPLDIAAGPDGNIWLTFPNGTTGKIGKMTTSGVLTQYSLPGTYPYAEGITAGPDGNMWFTEKNADKIGRITPSGAVTTYSLPTGSQPQDITQGEDGTLWFTETGSGKIGKIVG